MRRLDTLADVTYRFGIFEFERDTGELRRHGRRQPLERQPALVLARLLEGAGTLVSRDELIQHVWGVDTHVDFDRGLAYCLSQIRTALGDRSDNPRFVRTIPRRGYMFIAPVSVTADGLSADPVASVAPAVAALADTPVDAAASAPPRTRRPLHIVAASLAFALVVALLLGGWWAASRRPSVVRVAVSVFDNETGIAEYDRPVAALSDLVVTNLTALAPGRIDVIGNADVLRRPRGIRNLRAVADGVRADYLLLGQLQKGEQGLRFITHFIRLTDMAHLKANQLPLSDAGLTGLEAAVVGEFERATRQYLLTSPGN